MAYDDYRRLRVRVATVTLDHPPINLMDATFLQELSRLGSELAGDDAVRVAVFRSANPDFFIAHYDVGALVERAAGLLSAPSGPRPAHRPFAPYRLMPKVTIGQLEGRARGGGSEFLLALDMRFGALGRAIVAQPEVAIGILPGGGGTQRLPRLVGRARALEVILGADDIDAATAARYGYLNRALPPEELGPFVDRLAHRIARFPPPAIALAKAAVSAAEPPDDGFDAEGEAFWRAMGTAEARECMARFLALGGQTRERELALGDLLDEVNGSAGTAR